MFETGYVFLNLFLYFILVIKLTNIFLTVFHKKVIKSEVISEETFIIYHDNLQNMIIFSMSVLLIILFNPFTDKYLILTTQIKLFLFTFGLLEVIDFINNKQNLKVKYSVE